MKLVLLYFIQHWCQVCAWPFQRLSAPGVLMLSPGISFDEFFYHFKLWRKLYFILSIDKVPKVTSPVLVIHGTEDEVIDFSHGIAIHDKCQKPVEPLWVEVTLFSILLFFQISVHKNLVFPCQLSYLFISLNCSCKYKLHYLNHWRY